MTTRVAFIGSGFAQQHIAALAHIPEVEIAAICSRNEQTARQIIGDQNINYYPFENYLQMLQQEKLDAVYICLPPHLHGEIDIACAEHVKALFIEKPIALSLELADQLSQTFKKANSIVSVGYMNRYRPNIINAKNHFSKNPAILFNAAWSGELPPPYWWRRREMSGGQLTEQATHLIDSIRYISGEFKEVQAFSTSGFIDDVKDFNVDDAIVMNFQLESGAIGTVQTSCFSKEHGGGELGIYLELASREKTYRFHNHCMDLELQHSQANKEIFNSIDNPVLAENMAFFDAIKNGSHEAILSPYDDAVESLKVSLAADISIREKRSVALASL
ncbi:Gfo/Idh/MocA family oxidoreductase [Lentisphaera profundi]|uniref:Gfo/Idh/MocA family oxidoreductase n=1 Tax=Lentisphaera profundi TaxID=1658616 RepID=A0ABY7VQ53_9BACT|nr:Gfo/Idh/MocA family oxidoreductase [Lentisphaera profundi]WDE96122.1 Gfo/Idh/MocA family oxidoreductase [Lentisphaera profundi]